MVFVVCCEWHTSLWLLHYMLSFLLHTRAGLDVCVCALSVSLCLSVLFCCCVASYMRRLGSYICVFKISI